MQPKESNGNDVTVLTKKLNVWGFFLNCGCILLAFLSAGYLKFAPVPRVIGIHCDDMSIRKEYKGNTIGGPQIIIVVSVITACVILTTEGLTSLFDGQKTSTRYQLGFLSFGKFIYNSFNYWSGYFYGFAGYFLICCVIKLYCGRLRPHFLSVCDPDPKTFICDGANSHAYVEDFTCRGDPRLVKDARESFPSLHSAAAAGAAFYICVYLNVKITRPILQPVRTMLQLVFMVLALVASLQRITDHAHHWTDVVAGIVIGILGAFYTLHCIVHWFNPEETTTSGGCLASNGSAEPSHLKQT